MRARHSRQHSPPGRLRRSVWGLMLAMLPAVACEKSAHGKPAPQPAAPTFHPKQADVRDHRQSRFVWRDRCGNTMVDHPLAGGMEWEGDSRNYLALGHARVRGRYRGGLVMLAFPDGNVLHAAWPVTFKQGQAWRVQFAMSDQAAASSRNGLRFIVTAADAAGKRHVLVDRTLKRGDRKVYDERLRLPADIRRITFTHDNLGSEMWDVLWILPEGLTPPKTIASSAPPPRSAPRPKPAAVAEAPAGEAIPALRRAIRDLQGTFGAKYPRGEAFLAELAAIERGVAGAAGGAAAAPGAARQKLSRELAELRRRALLANPLVCEHPILFVARAQYRAAYHAIDTLYEVGEATEGRYNRGSELKLLDVATGKVRTLLAAPEGTIRGPCVHFDGKRVLLAMRRRPDENLHLYEIGIDGEHVSPPRQLTFAPDVSDFDPIYLPDDSIVFCSTREPKYNMCSQDIGANLFRMNADGTNIRQITKSTLFENQPALLPDGRILYKRWEYVDRNFGDAHGLWTVNPDGTNQATVYGNNTADPAAVYYGRPIPGGAGRMVCILSTHHHNMWGPLAVIDPQLGTDGKTPILRTWPAGVRAWLDDGPKFQCDRLNGIRPKYETPWPLSDKHFLSARMTGQGAAMGLYLIDTFGHEVLLHAEGGGGSAFSPMPLAPSRRPPVIPRRREYTEGHGLMYVQNVYVGTHMRGVKHGEVKRIRIVESPEKRGWSPAKWYGQGFMAPGMNWHDFTAKRILGTVPVEADGSAYFAVPADTFVYFQLLDARGMMIQSMRSGTVMQAGERTGCVGCHEPRLEGPPATGIPAALRRGPSRIEPWHEPGRIFSFRRDVQPVFDRHCVTCHDFGKPGTRKLTLAGDRGLFFNAAYTDLWRKRYLSAIGAGPADIQQARSWGSPVSKLVKTLRAGHNKVTLSADEWARLITWIDINAPYYPSYYCAYPTNAGGRCPLTNQELDRLGTLVGIRLRRRNAFHNSPGPQVSFDRPEQSPCLTKLAGKAKARAEALALIRLGARRLADRGRADSEDFRPCAKDLARERRYRLRRRIEQANRAAIRTGRLRPDDRTAPGT